MKWFIWIVFIISTITSPLALFAESDQDIYIPEQLTPWVEWVSQRESTRDCATLQSSVACVWPGSLSLVVTARSGSFQMSVKSDRSEELVQLPGGILTWPFEVKSSDKLLTVLRRDERPFAVLTKGTHEITGKFSWQEMPKFLSIPPSIGVIELSANGKQVQTPRVNDNGELWLLENHASENTEQDSLTVNLFRWLTDGVPFRVRTRVDLTIAGKARDITLENFLLEGSSPVEVQSDLPYRLSDNYSVVLQGKPGRFNLTFDAHFSSPPETLRLKKISSDNWPAQEVWVWQANNRFRSVQLKGADQVDAQRTELPAEWRSLPAYILSPDTVLTFDVSQRGEGAARPNQVNLKRSLWLDLDGAGYTVQDSFDGVMNQGWRLNLDAQTSPGRISSSGSNQVITTDPANGLAGVELRSRQIHVQADSRLESARNNFAAVGWDTDLSKLQVKIHLPPGWKLIGAVGPDRVLNSWISKWSLMDFFVIFLVSIATARLLGLVWGIVALLGLVLCHAETGAPLQLWFHLLAAVSLKKVIPVDGGFYKYITYYYRLVVFFLCTTLFFFAITQILYGLFPHLAPVTWHAPDTGVASSTYDDSRVSNSINMMFVYLEGSFGALVMIGSFLLAIGSFLMRRWKSGLGLLAIAFLAFMLRGVTATFFDDQLLRESPNAPVISQEGTMNAPMPARTEMFAGKMDLAEQYEYQDSGSSYIPQAKTLKRKQIVREYDPNAVIQTGPGVPNWTANTWSLFWNGPVEKSEQVYLYLFGPWINFLLSLVRIALLIALVFAFTGKINFGIPRRSVPAIVLLLSLLLFSPHSSYAQEFPDKSLLQELENRLNANRCTENCLAVNRLEFSLDEKTIEIVAQVSAKGVSSFAIPGPFEQAPLETLELDGKETRVIRRDERGFIWVRIPDGQHRLKIYLSNQGRNVVTLRFPQYPGSVSIDSPGWSIDGLEKSGRVQGSLQFTRKAETTAGSMLAGANTNQELFIPEWYKITRKLTLGLPWVMTTSVVRLGSINRPSIERFPLWSFERVASEGVQVEDGEAIARFERDVREVSWESTLEPTDQLIFVASANKNQNEEWYLQCSSIFHCESSGLGVTDSILDGNQEYFWQPFPGEQVTVNVSRPEAARGESITVDKASLEYRPGERLLAANLGIEVTASRGTELSLQLPEESKVQAVFIDNEELNLLVKKGSLQLPIVPRKQVIRVQWEQPYVKGFKFEAPEVRLATRMVNISVTVQMSPDRWILMTSGPAWGPAVLFWGKLLVVVLVALLLGRSHLVPVKTYEWILLGIGLATIETVLIAFPLLWFFLMVHRRNNPEGSVKYFNLRQVLIVGFSLMTLLVYYLVIQNGLILNPDMQIFGNGSTNTLLRWYLDMANEEFPRPAVYSFPLWVWRCVALSWALWLVFALLGWIRWGWNCFSEGGLWKRSLHV